MISLKANPNSQQIGLSLSSQETGCCDTVLTDCKYKFQYTTNPTAFTGIVVGGVTYAMVHTYSTPLALAQAIIDVLTKPTTLGGVGAHVGEGDVKVYLDPYSVTAGRLTIEFISGLVIDEINADQSETETVDCVGKTMCTYASNYTLTEAISINVNGLEFTLVTYATVALLRTALLAQVAALVPNIVTVQVKAGVTGTADILFKAVPGTTIYHDSNLLERGNCGQEFTD